MNRFIAVLAGISIFLNVALTQDKPANPKALELFMDGKTFELKDNYLAAIDKYNEALKIEKAAGIYFALAKLYDKVSQYQKSLEFGLEAIKLNNDNLTYKEHVADTYIMLGDYANALKYLKEIASKNPDDINILYNIGRMYEALKQPSEAIKIYEQITENYQYDETVLTRMVDIYENYKDYANTAATLEKLLVINPTDINLKYSAAAAYIKIPDYDKAIKIYEDILTLLPNNREVQAEVVKLYFRTHRDQEAFEKYSKLLNKDTTDFITKMGVAIAFFDASVEDKEALSVAKSILNTLHENYSREWMPEFYLALIDVKEEKVKEGEAKITGLVSAVDTSAELFVQAGFYYYEQNKLNESLDIFSKGTRLFPNDFRLNYLTGNTYYRMGKNKDALPYLEKAMDITPNDLNVFSTLGLVYDDLKMYPELDRMYEQALKYYPDNILLLNNYAYSLSERGERLKEALEMSKKTIEKEPENASYLDTYGWILFMLKDYKNAAIFVEKAIKIEKNATLCEHLGDIYEAQGEIVKALKAWNESLQIDSSNQNVKNKIDKYK
jgi:tetratricopeptide (TPR) repeat protein